MAACDCLQLIIWHTVCGAPIFILLRLVLILLSLLGAWPMIPTHMKFVKYLSNPIGKKMVYRKGEWDFNVKQQCYMMPSMLIQSIVLMLLALLHLAFGCLLLLLTCGVGNLRIFDRYHFSQIAVLLMDFRIEVVDMDQREHGTEPNAQPQSVASDAVTKPAVESTNTDQPRNDGQKVSRFDVAKWFRDNIELEEENERYLRLLTENGFDKYSTIKHLTKQDLAEIGIEKLGHQKAILRAIAAIDHEMVQQGGAEGQVEGGGELQQHVHVTNC
mmetsp:Transcript_31617/g.50868  ORF Transcript_31617/g.50868 Transcript_31617/m.50868 type:complete len:272 (+) Transcript_31617:23-838(+)